MFETFVKIDNSPISGLIFALIFLLITTMMAIYIIFLGGAKKESSALRERHSKMIIRPKKNSFIYSQIFIKIISASMALAGLFAVYCAISDL